MKTLVRYWNLLPLFLLLYYIPTSSIKANNANDTLEYKYIDIVHVTHTDYGYTDHPIIALDLHKRYLDIALDLALESQNNKPFDRFTWTAEALGPFYMWWNEASESRKKDMIKMINNNQIGVNSMPFHIHPFVNKELWGEMINWVPEILNKKFKIEVGMQHDVNGFPRSAALQLLDKDIHYLWTGINGHWGGSPFNLPTAFWWKMPDNRKILVWAGYPYWEGYTFFSKKEWRADQRDASNAEFSWPRDGDILNLDEESLREAHRVCIARLKDLREKGYTYPFITLSFTNQWRMDNDGPIAALTPFVKKWNELGLKPTLRLITAANAMKDIEKEIGKDIATYEGEWQDWWSFGLAASPRELQAARRALQYVKSSQSEFWGELSEESKAELKEIKRMLCRYYEHTFASNETSNKPFSLFNQGQLNEKNIYAFRPHERSKWLLGQLTRTKFTDKPEGLYVANTGKNTFSGWVYLDPVGFRGIDYKSVKDVLTNISVPLLRDGNSAYFWVQNLGGTSFKHLMLDTLKIDVSIGKSDNIKYVLDENNWIKSATWKDMVEPLFTEGIADFMSLDINEMNRWAMGDYIHMEPKARKEKIDGITKTTWAKPGKAQLRETEHTIIISQDMTHPRVKKLNRTIELYKNQARAKIKISFDRTSSMMPEVFYAKFPFPKSSNDPITTNGGIPFRPYKENLPNSCKDFFVVDSWVKYLSKDGVRVWSSVDVPLINFGGHNFCTRIDKAPENINELYGMLYNSVWVVNFSVDNPGEMSFEFDLFHDKTNLDDQIVQNIVDTYSMPIIKMTNPKARENKYVGKHMNTPRVVKNEQ